MYTDILKVMHRPRKEELAKQIILIWHLEGFNTPQFCIKIFERLKHYNSNRKRSNIFCTENKAMSGAA